MEYLTGLIPSSPFLLMYRLVHHVLLYTLLHALFHDLRLSIDLRTSLSPINRGVKLLLA